MPFDMTPRPQLGSSRKPQTEVREFRPETPSTSRGAGGLAKQARVPGATVVIVHSKKPGGRPRRRTCNELVRSLGFERFDEYLASPLFAAVRARVFEERGEACVRCSNPATEVHFAKHTRATLSGRSLDDLYPVCRDCSAKSKARPDGSKTTLAEATRFVVHSSSPQAAGEGPTRTGASQPAWSRRGARERRPEPDSARQ